MVDWKTDLENVTEDHIVMIFDPELAFVEDDVVRDKGIRLAEKHIIDDNGVRWIGIDEHANWVSFEPTHYAELPETPEVP